MKGKLYIWLINNIPENVDISDAEARDSYVKDCLDEALRNIPRALIYGTPEQEEGGYDHDDVWIIMDWIKEYFGSFVPNKDNSKSEETK